MNLHDLERKQKEYQSLKESINRISGEEQQLTEEGTRLKAEMVKLGFNTKVELEAKIKQLNDNIENIVKELEEKLKLCKQ